MRLLKKLQKRIGAEQSKKNSYKQQLEEALDKIKQLESGKSVKTLSDEDKAKKDVDEKGQGDRGFKEPDRPQTNA